MPGAGHDEGRGEEGGSADRRGVGEPDPRALHSAAFREKIEKRLSKCENRVLHKASFPVKRHHVQLCYISFLFVSYVMR